MLDHALQPQMQRSHGFAMARFACPNGRGGGGGAARIADLAQRGSAKIMLPRGASARPEVVFLNTSGGLTGGDRLHYALELEPGAQVCATTQTAERGYASAGGAPAQVRVQGSIAAGGHLDWLPQETILFQGADITRHTQIDLAQGATALLLESLILGRHAMGEVVTTARLTDHRRITRQGRPIWAETLRLGPDVLAAPDHPALLGGALALAVIVLAAPNAQDAVASLRALPLHDGARMAVSGWDGRCIIRITARDGWPLRQQILRVVTTLRGCPMPRVWQC